MIQDLAQAIEDTAQNTCNNMHTAMPGTIVSFDAATGLAVVQPYGSMQTPQGAMAYPQIGAVPVVFPFCQSANVGLAFPIRPGDNCLLIISEVELTGWRTGMVSQGSLRFDLSSAIAIPGLLRGAAGLVQQACASGSVVVQGGSVSISGSVTISGSLTVSGEIKGANITANGDVKGANVTATSDVTAGGISLKSHVHIANSEGEATGKPQ